jgi:peptidyl-prolyl cis-trans isomerase SurA
MRLLFIATIFIFLSSKLFALENKIAFKIENEIITTIDIKNERNYLVALNPNIRSLSENRLDLMSKNSLVREKIKELEILKYIKSIEVNPEMLNQFISQRYSRLNIENQNQFLDYLKKYNLKIKTVEKKISIEILWNQMIYQKFSRNVKINKKAIEDELIKDIEKAQKQFLLSEIVFKIDNKKDLKTKYSKIIQDIRQENFASAALSHSIADSSSSGGKLGWVRAMSLNKNINSQLSNLKKGELTKPILTPNGYLILKIDDIKIINQKRNFDTELKELIVSKTNQQLNQQSIIYFNKIKKNTKIYEF